MIALFSKSACTVCPCFPPKCFVLIPQIPTNNIPLHIYYPNNYKNNFNQLCMFHNVSELCRRRILTNIQKNVYLSTEMAEFTNGCDEDVGTNMKKGYISHCNLTSGSHRIINESAGIKRVTLNVPYCDIKTINGITQDFRPVNVQFKYFHSIQKCSFRTNNDVLLFNELRILQIVNTCL